jgi:hypothetical protein
VVQLFGPRKEKVLVTADVPGWPFASEWYQSGTSCLYISGKRRKEKAEEDRVVGGLCNDCLQVGNNQGDSQQDCER